MPQAASTSAGGGSQHQFDAEPADNVADKAHVPMKTDQSMDRRRTKSWHTTSCHYECRHQWQMLMPGGEDGRMTGNMVRDGGLTVHGPTRCTERKRQIATDQPRQKYLHPGMLEKRAHRLGVRALIVNCHYRRAATWPRRMMPAPAGWTQYAIGCTPSAPPSSQQTRSTCVPNRICKIGDSNRGTPVISKRW